LEIHAHDDGELYTNRCIWATGTCRCNLLGIASGIRADHVIQDMVKSWAAM